MVVTWCQDKGRRPMTSHLPHHVRVGVWRLSSPFTLTHLLPSRFLCVRSSPSLLPLFWALCVAHQQWIGVIMWLEIKGLHGRNCDLEATPSDRWLDVLRALVARHMGITDRQEVALLRQGIRLGGKLADVHQVIANAGLAEKTAISWGWVEPLRGRTRDPLATWPVSYTHLTLPTKRIV